MPASPERSFDGIILGAGHNALVLQAYLSRQGLRTLLLERAPVPGGGLSTIENLRLPGFLHNPHSFFHRAITAMPWFRDLELARRVRYIEPELNVAAIFRSGESLEWWTDLQRTEESFARISPRDAATLRRWAEEFRPIVEEVLAPEASSAPLEPARRREILERSRAGRRLLEVSAASPLEFVRREFEDDRIRAGLLFFNGLREVDLRLEGFGHSIPALLASPGKAQMCAGGSGQLARALVADIEEHGGVIRCGVEITRIVMREGRAAGIELSSGESISSGSFIASGLNPGQTFLDLLDPGAVPAGLREQARGFRYNLIAPLFGLHLALEEPPRYAAAERRHELEHAFMVVLGLEGMSGFHDLVAAHERGVIPPTIAWGAAPTLFDPGQAPVGKHTAFLWEKVPFALRGSPESWREDAGPHAAALFDFWAGFAPNLTGRTVLDAWCTTPLDTVRGLANMEDGDLLVGAFSGGQVGHNRPFRGAGRHRTSVPGLYLCGGSCHPGGNITGLPGHNAAAVIAADLGLVPWWRPRSIEEVLASHAD